jgi:hypothetical protein
MKHLLFLLCFLPLQALCQDVKVIINEDFELIYKSDTLYASLVANGDTIFISDDDVSWHLQDLLRFQNQTLKEEGIYIRYPDIIAMEIEQIATLLDYKSEVNYKNAIKNERRTITFYGPITLMLRKSHTVTIKKCTLVIENNKLIKYHCSYCQHDDVGIPTENTKFEYKYDEKGRIVKIFNKGKLEQTISYVEQQ